MLKSESAAELDGDMQLLSSNFFFIERAGFRI